MAQNQEDYQRKYDALVKRYEGAKAHFTELEDKISNRLSRRESISMFIKAVKSRMG